MPNSISSVLGRSTSLVIRLTASCGLVDQIEPAQGVDRGLDGGQALVLLAHVELAVGVPVAGESYSAASATWASRKLRS